MMSMISYGKRVGLLLTLFFTLGAYGAGALVAASRVAAEGDMHLGKGSVKFPPQVPQVPLLRSPQP